MLEFVFDLEKKIKIVVMVTKPTVFFLHILSLLRVYSYLWPTVIIVIVINIIFDIYVIILVVII